LNIKNSLIADNSEKAFFKVVARFVERKLNESGDRLTDKEKLVFLEA